VAPAGRNAGARARADPSLPRQGPAPAVARHRRRAPRARAARGGIARARRIGIGAEESSRGRARRPALDRGRAPRRAVAARALVRRDGGANEQRRATRRAFPAGRRAAEARQRRAPEPALAITPDGAHVVFVAEEHGQRRLYVRTLGSEAVTAVPGS